MTIITTIVIISKIIDIYIYIYINSTITIVKCNITSYNDNINNNNNNNSNNSNNDNGDDRRNNNSGGAAAGRLLYTIHNVAIKPYSSIYNHNINCMYLLNIRYLLKHMYISNIMYIIKPYIVLYDSMVLCYVIHYHVTIYISYHIKQYMYVRLLLS